VVCNSAEVTIIATALFERFIGAAIGSVAAIFSTWITVVTGRFVNFTITVVVNPIAGVWTGLQRIAIGEAGGRTDSLTRTVAILILDFAYGLQG
jgi:ABC-type dipeptide/oligopeptide/nickel transport system permease subunit